MIQLSKEELRKVADAEQLIERGIISYFLYHKGRVTLTSPVMEKLELTIGQTTSDQEIHEIVLEYMAECERKILNDSNVKIVLIHNEDSIDNEPGVYYCASIEDAKKERDELLKIIPRATSEDFTIFCSLQNDSNDTT